jgi:hypothetical protein
MDKNKEEVNLGDFGLKSRPSSRRREDLGNGNAEMYLLSHEAKARDRNILLTPDALHMLGIDPNNKESHVAFNFVGGAVPFLTNITGQNLDALPKGAALKVIFNHKKYLGGYIRAKKIWEHCGGEQKNNVKYSLEFHDYALPSLSFTRSIADEAPSRTNLEEEYSVAPSVEEEVSSLRKTTTSYMNN